MKYEADISSMSLTLREEYTAVALKRSASIEGGLPIGYFNLVHAIATIPNAKGDTMPIAKIESQFGANIGAPTEGAKEIMVNLGKLTALPFPIVESTKKISPFSDETITTPLYNVADGTTTDKRYASVKLSELGHLLTRHYQNEPMGFSDHYKSFVPMTLLRKSMPWTMGHRSQMYPLNPSELFRLQARMLELGHPFVSDNDLKQMFKGFDLGDGYSIYMTSSALQSLFTTGESSFISVPDITIDRKLGVITIEVPPMDQTSKQLKAYLTEKALSTSNGFNTFKYNPEVKVVTVKVQMEVEQFLGTDEEILEELRDDKNIKRKMYVRNETIRYKEDISIRDRITEDGTLGRQEVPLSLINQEEALAGMTQEEIQNLTELELLEALSKATGKNIVTDDGIIQIKRNPYPFELDVIPVYETLWKHVNWELDIQKKEYEKELAKMKDKAKYDLLLEKVTRPDVASLVHTLSVNPRTRFKDLYNSMGGRLKINLKQRRVIFPDEINGEIIESELKEITTPNGETITVDNNGYKIVDFSKVLPEKLEPWEINLVYEEKGNNYLGRIFNRGNAERDYMSTLQEIKRLEDILNDPVKLREKLKAELLLLADRGKYQRKSKVFFVREQIGMRNQMMVQKDDWDDLDLPVTVFYNGSHFRRNYGVNMQFGDFIPLAEINTTNKSKISFATVVDGKLVTHVRQVNQIPSTRTTATPKGFVGILPVASDEDWDKNEKVIFWTSRGRYFIYENIMTKEVEWLDEEIIIGWEYLGEPTDFMTIRCQNGITRNRVQEYPMFGTKLVSFPTKFGVVFDIIFDKEDKPIVPIRLQSNIDEIKFDRVLTKSKTATPIPLGQSALGTFNRNTSRYFEKTFLKNWAHMGAALLHLERNESLKEVYLEERAWVKGTAEAHRLEEEIRQVRFDLSQRADTRETVDIIIPARYTKSYLNFDKDKFKDTGAIKWVEN